MGTCALGRSGLSKDDWVNLCPEVRGTGILTGALWGGVALLRGSTESLCWEWGPQEQRHWSRILRTSLSEERQESREYGSRDVRECLARPRGAAWLGCSLLWAREEV